MSCLNGSKMPSNFHSIHVIEASPPAAGKDRGLGPVIVLGDSMTDYWWPLRQPSRLSAEAPIPVFEVDGPGPLAFPGGMANVVSNLSALGVEVMPVWGAGCISHHRLVCDGHQLARFDVSPAIASIDLDLLKKAIGLRSDWKAAIISDYGRGSVSKKHLSALPSDLPVFVDSRRSPWLWAEDRPVTFFPNQREFDQHSGDYEQVLEYGFSVILKQGPRGIRDLGTGAHYPTFASRVVSVCGAGDTVIAAYVAAVLADDPDPLLVAALAAGAAVEQPYTSSISWNEINAKRNNR